VSSYSNLERGEHGKKQHRKDTDDGDDNPKGFEFFVLVHIVWSSEFIVQRSVHAEH